MHFRFTALAQHITAHVSFSTHAHDKNLLSPYCHSHNRCALTMEDSPSVAWHRDWVEQLIETPTPRQPRGSAGNRRLTQHESPTEHVLRGSKSFAARSFRSRVSATSLRAPQKENRSTTDADTTRQSICEDPSARLPVLGEIQPNNQLTRPGLWRLRPSPTPTLTKKAAEAIVKAHGSPQHVRVTAGGRIVPSEQSPLCHPRYGYSAIKANGGLVKFAPNHPMGQKQQWTQATQNGFVAQDMDGRLCQIVNGTILPLNEVDGALRLYMPAPNLNIDTSRNPSFGPPAQVRNVSNGAPQRDVSQGSRAAPTEPSSAAQANALELEYSKLEHELRELDKTEVLHGRTMGKAAKDALVSKRRELVVSMDNIRRAIKGLKSQPPPDAPTSPRAMQPHRQSASPPGRNRLPPFLQNRMHETAVGPMQSAFSGFLSALPAHGQSGPFGYQPSPSPDAQIPGQPFGVQPLGIYVAPPPFDGPVGHGLVPFPAPSATSVTQLTGNNVPAQEDAQIPQTDGAWSLADRQKLSSPRASRAIDIKAPPTGLKSTLDPMSPAYKPGFGALHGAGTFDAAATKSVKDRAPTPLSPLHQLRAPEAVTIKNPNATDDTISPNKKVPHLHSSSVSSFQTADFFPRNTGEYSTRKEDYADSGIASEDKENVDPLQYPATPGDRQSEYTASDPITLAQTPGFHGPTAPPGTPISGQAAKPSASIDINVNSVPNRDIDNLSPKGKRQHMRSTHDQASSASEILPACSRGLSVHASPEKLDFTQASVEWIEGYRAGLSRKPVGVDQGADFMDGYCAGVLKSKPTINGPSTGSPKRSASRRPSPAALLSRTSSHQKLDRREPTPVRPALENSLESMDTLKEAIFAPGNESAILTPQPEGPHINDAAFNLGSWAKQHGSDKPAGFPFPDRTTSAMCHQTVASDGHATEDGTAKPPTAPFISAQQYPGVGPSSASLQNASLSQASVGGNRVSSMTSIDSNLYRQYPGHRVFSPHLEWRSASSVARAAGIAAGSFTSAQYDGSNNSARDCPVPMTSATTQQQRVLSLTADPTMATHGRFREASLDGLSDPAISSPPASPPMSPNLSPKDNASPNKAKKTSSPSKSGSPAKRQFENIAEKVGIKVAKDNSPNSPPGKRRWRNVWLGGKKEGSRDEVA